MQLCYVGHHDEVYEWAERRRLETHPKTGAAQLVETRETVKKVVVPVYVQPELPTSPKLVAKQKPPFAKASATTLHHFWWRLLRMAEANAKEHKAAAQAALHPRGGWVEAYARVRDDMNSAVPVCDLDLGSRGGDISCPPSMVAVTANDSKRLARNHAGWPNGHRGSAGLTPETTKTGLGLGQRAGSPNIIPLGVFHAVLPQ